MKIYKYLRIQEVKALPVNSLVYVTCKAKGLERAPAFTLMSHSASEFVFVAGETVMNLKQYALSMNTFSTSWTVMIENGFTVQTPDGTLHALNSGGGEEYPGIRIDLIRPGSDFPVSLSMTEYIPGGEGICGYDPRNPHLTDEQIAEVPLGRIVDEDGKPIRDKSSINSQSGCVVTAGLATRIWPDEVHNEEYHKRVFHIGYTD